MPHIVLRFHRVACENSLTLCDNFGIFWRQVTLNEKFDASIFNRIRHYATLINKFRHYATPFNIIGSSLVLSHHTLGATPTITHREPKGSKPCAWFVIFLVHSIRGRVSDHRLKSYWRFWYISIAVHPLVLFKSCIVETKAKNDWKLIRYFSMWIYFG